MNSYIIPEVRQNDNSRIMEWPAPSHPVHNRAQKELRAVEEELWRISNKMMDDIVDVDGTLPRDKWEFMARIQKCAMEVGKLVQEVCDGY